MKKQNLFGLISAALLISAQMLMGCAAGGDDVTVDRETGPANAIAAEQTSIHHVEVKLGGELHRVDARAGMGLNEQLLKEGFKGLQGDAAIQAFLTEVVQRTVDETGNVPEGTVTIAPHKADPNAVNPESTCISCYDVYYCPGDGWCYYQYTICYYWQC
jgi:hypothetical protein